jgi:hypothetical protein
MKNTANIITLTKTAIASVQDARVARWNLGQALLTEFYTKVGGELVTNRSQDAEAMTVSEFAKANYKNVDKSFDALKVFYSEAISFAKKHKTVESAKKDTIKKKKTEDKRFNAKSSATNAITRLGEANALKMARAILALAGE